MMNKQQNEEAHILIMNTIKPDCVRGNSSVIFEYAGVTYELETLLEVVVFVNKYLEGK